jgi:hypothetical protein
MNHARFYFLKPVGFFANVDDPFHAHVSSVQQSNTLLAARLSLRVRKKHNQATNPA